MEDHYKKVIAIDFDGCICENDFPYVGFPHWKVINEAKAEQEKGAKLILWTCREGEYLEDALAACHEWGLYFDAVNDSVDSWKKNFKNNTRKVGADEYWDDRAVRKP